jgi:ABC-type polar amino acid transport system ATPase subunit
MFSITRFSCKRLAATAGTLLLAVAVLCGCRGKADKRDASVLPELTVGIQVSPAMTLVMVAEDKGFFDAAGVDVVIKEFTAGKFALRAFLGGSLDVAISGEVPVTLATLQGNKFRVIAQVVERTVNECRVVVRRDETASTPEAYFKAKRRTLATSFGGGPEFFTHEFLKKHGLTVAGNTAFGLAEMPTARRERRVSEILARIEMTAFGKRYPAELSGGQVQRVALARSLAPNPQVLLMDEPYAALDHHTREAMQEWLLSVWGSEKKTVIFVTNYIEEAIYLADRLFVLHEHRIAASFDVPFERPRRADQRFTPEFLALKHAVLAAMTRGIASSDSCP